MTGAPVKRQRRERFEQFTAEPDRAMAAIVEHVSKGRGLTSFALGVDLPVSSLHDWIRLEPSRGATYDQARIRGAAALAEESLAVLDTAERGSDGLPTSATVGIVKAKSDTLKWLAARLSPKDWGDSIAVNSTVHIEVDIRAILAKREERLFAMERETVPALAAKICARETLLPPQQEQQP